MVLHWHYAGTTLVHHEFCTDTGHLCHGYCIRTHVSYCTGTALAFYNFCKGTTLVLHKHWLVLHSHYTSSALALVRHKFHSGTALALELELHGLNTGAFGTTTVLGLFSTGAALVWYWHCIGAALVVPVLS